MRKMKIAIIGGGISGLSTYLNLQKHVVSDQDIKRAVDITIYEHHGFTHVPSERPDHIPSFGGGYGLAPNGMASLRRLDPEIHEHILRNGFPSPKTTMKSARGWTLGMLPGTDVRGDHLECCIMVLREVVIRALYERVDPSVIVKQKVVAVEDGENEAKVTLDNGETFSFDLVIGADGIWSRSRRAILGDKHCAEYKGLLSVGGFVPTNCLPSPPEVGQAAHSQTVMTFGPNGFFGYTPYTTGDVSVTEKHLRGEENLPPGKMAFWWSRSAQAEPTANPDEAALHKELVERHQSWKAPTIHKILENSEVKLKTPTWVLPKIPTWAGERVVLVGDAAHALPTSSGQGVSQCLEDAEALSTLLGHNLAKSSHSSSLDLSTLRATFQQFMAVRKAHVEKVLDVGNRGGDVSRDMGPIAEIAMYGLMWSIFKLFGAFFLKPVINYDVIKEVEKVMRQA